MKIFYDKDGKAVGFVEGALEEIEAEITMPNTTEVIVPSDVAEMITDPKIDLSINDIIIDKQSK